MQNPNHIEKIARAAAQGQAPDLDRPTRTLLAEHACRSAHVQFISQLDPVHVEAYANGRRAYRTDGDDFASRMIRFYRSDDAWERHFAMGWIDERRKGQIRWTRQLTLNLES